jgi:hypothetical protein
MSTVTWTAVSQESIIGPPSELIHIDHFLSDARNNEARAFMTSGHSQQAAGGGADFVPQDDIASECRLVSHTSNWIIR